MITFLSDKSLFTEKEKLYAEVRTIESRMYSDEEVKRLPYISENHPHEKEWKIRLASFNKLKKRMASKNTPLDILDVGCGNGWMSHRFSEMENWKVTGIDVNESELRQADRLFGGIKNLQFMYGNVTDHILPPHTYDVIVMAASLQYFPDLSKLITELLLLLRQGGEIHIIDSPVYSENQVAAARVRSQQYYARLGVSAMSAYYFHHHWNEFQKFSYRLLNRSAADYFKLHVLRNKSLRFPWIVIRNTL